jgi:hypothetical protein
METSIHLEPVRAWGQEYVGGEEWARLQSLLELVRRGHRSTELSAERLDKIRERVLARVEQAEARRRRWLAVVAGAGAVLLLGLALVVWWWSSGQTLGERRPGIRG